MGRESIMGKRTFEDPFIEAMYLACQDLGDGIHNLSCLYENWRKTTEAEQERRP